MQRVAVGSDNPDKVEGVRRAFAELHPGGFEVHPVAVEGGEHQPWGEAATRDGALRRAGRALASVTGAHWGIGLEGGMIHDDTGVLVTSWIAARHADGRQGLARTAGFYLPDAVAAIVLGGSELADAWRYVHGIKRIGRHGGSVGLLTAGRLQRARLYSETVVLAVSLAEHHQA